MMIKARHSRLARLFFEPYLHRLFRKHFHALDWPETPVQVKEKKSVLLVANHFSWWDGFFWYKANQQIFKKKFHILMLEEQLHTFWFFRFLGAFSVRKNSRDVLETLQYAVELLNDPNNLVLIFPQGAIQVPWVSEVQTGKGATYVWRKVHPYASLFYGVVLTHYGSQPKPTAKFFLQEATSVEHFAEYYSETLQETEKTWST